MLSTALILEIRRLLDEGQLSQRAIAARLQVSRGTVWALANGRRGWYGADSEKCRPHSAPPSAPVRCPGCGGLVYLPCRLCQIRGAMARRAGRDPRRAA